MSKSNLSLSSTASRVEADRRHRCTTTGLISKTYCAADAALVAPLTTGSNPWWILVLERLRKHADPATYLTQSFSGLDIPWRLFSLLVRR